jgi:hypothetical protein
VHAEERATNFPDPGVSGRLTIDEVVNESSVDPNSAVWKKAIRACRDLEPSGFTGHKMPKKLAKAGFGSYGPKAEIVDLPPQAIIVNDRLGSDR